MLDRKKALEISRHSLTTSDSELHAAAIFIALTCGDTERADRARSQLHFLAASQRRLDKCEAAYIIGEFHDHQFDLALKNLINDSDDRVSVAAIQAAARINDILFMPDILQRLKPGQVVIAIRKAIITYGNEATPYLLEKLQHDDKNNIYYLKLLIAIASIKVMKLH